MMDYYVCHSKWNMVKPEFPHWESRLNYLQNCVVLEPKFLCHNKINLESISNRKVMMRNLAFQDYSDNSIGVELIELIKIFTYSLWLGVIGCIVWQVRGERM